MFRSTLARRHVVVPVVIVALVAGMFVNIAAAGAVDQAVGVALFEGKEIQLADGWGEATACLIDGNADVVECFRTEEELKARIVQLERTQGSQLSVQSWCSGYLSLYDGTNYSGSVLYVRDRYHWINLATYGFSNRTSSFRISACPAIFADGEYGAGDWYPTSQTEAWDESASMLSGWNNRVSSIYIG